MNIFTLFGEIVLKDGKYSAKIDDSVKKAKDAGKDIEKALDVDVKTSNLGNFFDNLGKSVNNLGSQVLSAGSAFNNLAGTASSALSSMGKNISAIGSKVTVGITAPLLAAGTAFAGLAISKGWGRVTAIDSATVKLQALGNSIEDVAIISENANKSVTGTAHGLDEAFTVAAQASASGVQAGKEMETYLRRVADAASFAEVGMDDMGSIFNKVLTGGVAQAQELNQMADRGIPIFQMLADSMGVSADEVKGLASEGAITADVLFKAFDGIEGYAKKGAATFAGAWSLAMSSVSRIGANIFGQFDAEAGEVTGLLSLMKDGALALRDALIPLEALSSRLGDSLTEMLSGPLKNFEKFAKNWKEMDEDLQISALKQVGNYVMMAAAAGPFLLTVGKLASTAGAMGKNVTKVGKSISKFTTTVTKSGGPISKLSSRLAKVGKEGSALNGVMKGLGGSLGGVAKFIGGLLTILTGVGSLGFVMAGVAGIVAAFGLIPEGMRDALQDTLRTVRTRAPEVLNNLSNMFETRLPEIIKRGSELLTDALTTVTEVLPDISQVGQSLLKGLLEGMQSDGQPVFDAVVGLITALGQAFVDNIGLIFSLGTLFIIQLSNAIANNSDEIVTMAITLIETLTLGLIEALPQLANAAIQIINGLIEGVKNNKEKIVEMVQTIITALMTSFDENREAWLAIGALILGKIALGIIASAGTQMLGAGLSTIARLVAGIVSGKGLLIAAAVMVVGWIISKIVEHWPEIVAKGKEIIEKLIEGIKTMFSNIKETAGELLDSFVSGINDFASKLVSAGAGIVDNVKQGIANKWGELTGWFRGKLNDLRNMLPFSPPKDKSSPLYGLENNGIVEMIAKGVLANEGELTNALRQVLDQDLSMGSVGFNPVLSGAGVFGSSSGYNANIGYQDMMSKLNDIVNQLRESNEANEYLMAEQNRVIAQNANTYLDGREVSKVLKPHLDYESKVMESRNKRLRGER